MAQVALKRKDQPPVNIDYARSVGLTDSEWNGLVNALGRTANEFECLMFSLLWSENNSQKSSHLLLESLRQSQKEAFAENVLYSSRSPYRFVEIGEGKAICQIIGHSNTDTAEAPAFGGSVALNSVLDEFVTLGAEPVAFVNLLRMGDHERPKTQQSIQFFMDGLSRYSNAYGVSISNGDIYFHPSYNNTICANLGVLGIVDKKNLNELTAKPPLDSPLLCIGYKTPPLLRDDAGKIKAVRLADPYLEQRLIELFKEAIAKGLIVDLCPMAKGGIVRASFLLANRSQRGIQLFVDKIPTEAKQMALLDVLQNQSAGRFLVITLPEKHRALSDHFSPHGIDCTTVGLLTDTDDVELIANHLILGSAPYKFGAVPQGRTDIVMTKTAPMLRREELLIDDSFVEPLPEQVSLEDVWVDILANPNLCSRHLIAGYFDERAKSSVVIKNGADAAVILIEQNNDKKVRSAIAVTVDSNSLYVEADAYLGTAHSIAEAMQNLASVGVRPQGLSYCLNIGNPDEPMVRAELSEATRAIDDLSIYWNIPILSESVSSSIGGRYIAGMPTPAIMMFGEVPEITTLVTPYFKEAGDKVFVLAETDNDLACSEYANYTFKQVSKIVPNLDLEVIERICTLITLLVRNKIVVSAHDLSGGGLAIALTECCVLRPGKPIGLNLEILATEKQKGLRREVLLFAETPGRFIVSCKAEEENRLRELCQEYGVTIGAEGKVGGREIQIKGLCHCNISVSTAKRIWTNGLNHMFSVAEE